MFATHCLSLVTGIEMQFVKVYVGPSGWGVTVYKLYAVYTCMEFMFNLLWCVCPQFRIAAQDQGK